MPTIPCRLAAAALLTAAAIVAPSPLAAQVQGDSAAVAAVERLLAHLGGRERWAGARTISVHLRGHLASDPDPWDERYWIDLVVPGGRYEIRAGGRERIIAWSAAGGWESRDGVVEPQSADRHRLEQAYWTAELTVLFRRLAGGPAMRVVLDSTAGGRPLLSLFDPARPEPVAALALDAAGRPIHWSASITGRTFTRILGPLADFGGIALPAWGATPDGEWRYQHLAVSLSGDPPPSFAPPGPAPAARNRPGLRGDSAAVAAARAMVAAMGGIAVWRELGAVRFVHDWDLAGRIDRYREVETLDLVAPRSHVVMESEIYRRVRAYSPEHGYWNVVNGVFRRASDAELADALERAPFSLYRLARAVAADDSTVGVEFGPMRDLPGAVGLVFRGPDDRARGWILLNQRHEPVVWATSQYSYAMGPLERYGNLRVPRWASTGGGRVRYEMVSLTGSREPPDPALFVPPGR